MQGPRILKKRIKKPYDSIKISQFHKLIIQYGFKLSNHSKNTREIKSS